MSRWRAIIAEPLAGQAIGKNDTKVDIVRAGGVSQWMKLAGMAEASNLMPEKPRPS